MAKKTKTEGTLLYPGVILKGNNTLTNPSPLIPDMKARRNPTAIRKADAKINRRKDRRLINVWIEE